METYFWYLGKEYIAFISPHAWQDGWKNPIRNPDFHNICSVDTGERLRVIDWNGDIPVIASGCMSTHYMEAIIV